MPGPILSFAPVSDRPLSNFDRVISSAQGTCACADIGGRAIKPSGIPKVTKGTVLRSTHVSVGHTSVEGACNLQFPFPSTLLLISLWP